MESIKYKPLAEDRFFVATNGGVGIKTTDTCSNGVELDVYGDIKISFIAIGDTGRSAIDFSARTIFKCISRGANRDRLLLI